MSTSNDPRRDLIALFDEMGSVLELLGANGFKVNANRKVARVLEDLTGDITAYRDDPKGLQAMDGIGKSSAVKEYHWSMKAAGKNKRDNMGVIDLVAFRKDDYMYEQNSMCLVWNMDMRYTLEVIIKRTIDVTSS